MGHALAKNAAPRDRIAAHIAKLSAQTRSERLIAE
jgi:hypothetical protein